MTSPPAPATRPYRDDPVDGALICNDQAVLQALVAACRLHEGPVTVLELVWAWAADLWWNAVTDPNPAVDAMTIPHTPSRADLARVRRRLTALHRRRQVVRTGHPARWQPLESSNAALDDSDQVIDLKRPLRLLPGGTVVENRPNRGTSDHRQLLASGVHRRLPQGLAVLNPARCRLHA